MSDAARGRDVISTRAMEAVVRAVTAEAFGVAAKSVQADLADDGGRLALSVRTPIRLVSIDRLQHEPSALQRSGGSVLERAAAAERSIADRVSDITGTDVQQVGVRITAADVTRERRVR
jgi:hypothetical protein